MPKRPWLLRRLLGAALSLLLASELQAQVPQEVLPSFKADQLFDFGGVDRVNIYSGDVQATIPLGPEYSLGAGLTWRLSASYSNRYWNLYKYSCGDETDPCRFPLTVDHAVVMGRPSVGPGWTVDLGYITGDVLSSPDDLAWPRYHASDGSIHVLKSVGNGLFTTDDGLFARFRYQASGPEQWILERPDGSRWLYAKKIAPPPSPNGWDFFDGPYAGVAETKQYLFTGIENPYDAQAPLLSVVYREAQPWQVDSISIGDRTIRFIWTTFQTTAEDDVPSVSWPVIDRIEFPASHGQTLRATFGYADLAFARARFETRPERPCNFPSAPKTIRLPYLSAITLGDQLYSFSYQEGYPGYGGSVLESIELPTGGLIEYQYSNDLSSQPCLRGSNGCPSVEDYVFPPPQSVPEAGGIEEPICTFRPLLGYIDSSPTIFQRTESDPVGLVSGYTTYRRKSFYEPDPSEGNPPDLRRVVRLVVVERPDGNGGRNATKYFFSFNGSGGPTGAEIERRLFIGTDVGPTAVPLKSVVSCYDDAALPNPGISCGVTETAGVPSSSSLAIPPISWAWPNRPRREVTWYGENPPAGGICSETTATAVACWVKSNDGWNALADEFTQSTIRIPRNGPSLVFLQSGLYGRQTTTNWAPYDTPRWLPKLFSWRTVSDLYDSGATVREPSSVTTSYDFDSTYGKLRSTTVEDGASSLTHQLDYGESNGPDPLVERHVGGGLVTGTYATRRTFQNGQVLSARREAPQDLGWYQFRVQRDSSTDAETFSYDPNGLSTSFTWDAEGRISTIAPPGEALTRFCYGMWSPGATAGAAYVLKLRGMAQVCPVSRMLELPNPSEGSGTAEAWVYDGFGRLVREIRLLPTPIGGTHLAVRVTTRNDAGLVNSISEWTPCGSGTDPFSCFSATSTTITTYSGFDILGRPTLITRPDLTTIGKGYDDYDYATGHTVPSSDFRETTIVRDTSSGHTWEAVRRDLFGRVIIATEPHVVPVTNPALTEAPEPLSTSDWNVLDKLVLYTSARAFPTGLVTQTRSFAYNRFGFMTGASDPETGSTTFSLFDALGNSRLRSNGGVDVSSNYDALGRLIGVSSGSVPYSTTCYDGSEPGAVRSDAFRGKLTKRIGYNPGSLENARIEDTFTYGGPGGQLSSRQTAYFRAGSPSSPFASLVQEQTWNSLGLPQTRTLSGTGGSLQTTTYYTAAAPTRIISGAETLVSLVKYRPYGGLASYTTGNGVETLFDADAHRMPRPSRIHTTGANGDFDTGLFGYDGAGNIVAMGSDSFQYDRSSRLKSATWGSVPGSPSETFFYDGTGEMGFGSLTRITGSGASIPAEVLLTANPTTNRLSEGSYDQRGNLLAFPSEGSTWDTFTYDALSRRTSDSRAGAVTSWHLYDAEGERVGRVLPPSTTSTAPLRFFTVPSFRLLDPRTTDGPDGGPYLTARQAREFLVVGQCGIPSAAASLAGNLTVSPRADTGGITGTHTFGFMKMYPGDISPTAAAAAVINPTKTRAQFAFGKLSAGGSIRLFAEIPTSETVNAILDVYGYFAPASGVSTTRTWLLTQRDDANRPVADWRWQEGASSITPTAFHVFLGATKVASLDFTSTPQWYFFSSDHLGTPRLRTTAKAQGAEAAPVAGSYRYRAFGQAFDEITPLDQVGFEFAMMERDPILPAGATVASGSGHHYDHARFFADRFARFLSPDQLYGRPEDPQSWNRYTYARNNPLRYVDPDGRAPQEAGEWDKDPVINQMIQNALYPTPTVDPASSLGVVLGSITDPFGTMGEGIRDGDAGRFGLGFVGFGLGIAMDRGGRLVETPGVVPGPYRRPSGATTPAQRAAVQGKPCVDCGQTAAKMVADHKDAISSEYYRTGSIDKKKMRDVSSVQPQCPTCSAKQGGFLSGVSKLFRKVLGLDERR